MSNYGEWQNEPADWYPGSDDDEMAEERGQGDNEPEDELTPDYLPADEEEAWRDEPDYDSLGDDEPFPQLDVPKNQTFVYRSDELYERLMRPEDEE